MSKKNEKKISTLEGRLPIRKDKKILLRVSDNLNKAIQKAVQVGIADNTAEFVRRCIVNQLLELKLLGTEENE